MEEAKRKGEGWKGWRWRVGQCGRKDERDEMRNSLLYSYP